MVVIVDITVAPGTRDRAVTVTDLATLGATIMGLAAVIIRIATEHDYAGYLHEIDIIVISLYIYNLISIVRASEH